ncbi:MAG TPA: lytic murein transglycosylase [Candidatus Paceibacterota bacterium]|nr:lytic murein transglycosylase [Candidatus Paceibacterota bacterium]
MYRAFSLIVLTLATLSLSAPYGAEAATDPIADFCASPTALADAQAQRECQDLVALQASNAKIKGEKDSIEKEVKDIDGQIAIAQQKIKVQNTIIATLTKDIGTKTVKINGLQAKIDQDVDSVTDLIQKVNQQDAVSVVSVLLGNKSFSDFYIELDTLHALNKQLTNLISEVRSNKVETESEKQSLQDRKDKETDAKVAIEAEKRLIDRKKAEKAALLASKTADYTVAQKLLTEQKQKVAQIRARLFKFQDGEGIPFGDAYDYAARAARVTGVRPAFLLAIITQESSFDSADSSFGKNIGQCYLRDTSTGAGVSVASGAARSNVMHPTRDVPVFLQIADALGRDYQNTRVSCALSYGYGGAMGPAQFIPSTWALYAGYPSPSYAYVESKDRIRKAFGFTSPSNPFDAEHAISASSLFLGDLGAGLQTYSAEKNAACKYYSGKSCPTNPTTKQQRDIVAYGASVANRAIRIQEEMIDPILGK